MQTITLIQYKELRALQAQARQLLDRLELLAKYDVERAEKLTYAAWERYSRRTAQASSAAAQHWG